MSSYCEPINLYDSFIMRKRSQCEEDTRSLNAPANLKEIGKNLSCPLSPGCEFSLDDPEPVKQLASASMIKRLENAQELNDALMKKQLSIQFLEQDFGNCFYSAISYALSHLPSPFNISYPVKVLRHKTSEYMIGHKLEFVKKKVDK